MKSLLHLIHHKKVGGLHFVRLGKLSVSFCVTRKPAKRVVDISAEYRLSQHFAKHAKMRAATGTL